MTSPQQLNDGEKALVFNVFSYLDVLKNRVGIDEENINVAIQCLGEALKVNFADSNDAAAYRIASYDLKQIFDAGVEALGISLVQEAQELPAIITNDPAVQQKPDLWKKWISKLEAKGFFNNVTPGTPEHESRYVKALEKFKEKFCAGESVAAPVVSEFSDLSEEDREAQAEECKAQGNACISSQQYEQAVEHYARAIQLSPEGPKTHIYYANQAAAYTHLLKYDNVIQCCEKAIELKPSYSKSYSRLGFAQLQLQDFEAAIDSYRRGLEHDPNNQACTEGLAEAETKKQQAAAMSNPSARSAAAPGGMPDLSNLASMLGGAGGAGGGGLASMLNNPALQQMAQGMMQNPAMMQMAQNMMQNPEMMRNMMGGGNGGGEPSGESGTPDVSGAMDRLRNNPEFASLRNDPDLSEFFQDLETQGPMGAMRHMSNPVVSEKLSKVLSQLQ